MHHERPALGSQTFVKLSPGKYRVINIGILLCNGDFLDLVTLIVAVVSLAVAIWQLVQAVLTTYRDPKPNNSLGRTPLRSRFETPLPSSC